MYSILINFSCLCIVYFWRSLYLGQWDGEMQVTSVRSVDKGSPALEPRWRRFVGALESHLRPVPKAHTEVCCSRPTRRVRFCRPSPASVVGTSRTPSHLHPQRHRQAVSVFRREVDVMEGRGAAFVPAGSSTFGVPVASSAATAYVCICCQLVGCGKGGRVGCATFASSLLSGQCLIFDDPGLLTQRSVFAMLCLASSRCMCMHFLLWCVAVARMP